MTKTPSADDLHTAAQWLDVYEGAEDAEACQRGRIRCDSSNQTV